MLLLTFPDCLAIPVTHKQRVQKRRSLSRSKHTDPRAIRAERRLASPRARRGIDDPSRKRRLGRLLKEMGIVHTVVNAGGRPESVRPRIIVQKPRQGYTHPAARSDITSVLEAIGPEATYGLTAIALSRTPEAVRAGLPPLGRLSVPGKVVIYEQPVPPWRLTGRIHGKDVGRLSRAGAIVEYNRAVDATIIDWPEGSLRDFMLFEVLLHEVGHHILQHHKGKRTARIARTRDHEAFAQSFADKCRAAWFGEAHQK